MSIVFSTAKNTNNYQAGAIITFFHAFCGVVFGDKTGK
jgi:hypothetical protein